MGKSSPEKSDASPLCCRALLRGRPLHYLLTAVFGNSTVMFFLFKLINSRIKNFKCLILVFKLALFVLT